MKPSERAEEIRQFLADNAEGYGELAEQYKNHPAAPSLIEAQEGFTEKAADAAIVKQALEDRDAVFIHLRNVAETAFNTARIELTEGKNPEDIVEKARAAVLKALPLKRAQ